MGADEAVQSVFTGKIDYTLPYYLDYLKALKQGVEELKEQDSSFEWTVHKLELALWSKKIAQQVGIDIGEICENMEEETKEHEDSKPKKTLKTAANKRKTGTTEEIV